MVDLTNYKYLQITGCYKSGTSLLFSLLDGHPDLSNFPTETSHTGYMFNQLTSSKTKHAKKIELYKSRYLRLRDRFGEKLYSDILNAFDELSASEPYDFWKNNLFFIDAYCLCTDPDRHKNASYYMDKSPLSYLFADQIFQNYTNTKFIHIVREPKNNFSSIMAKFQKNKRTIIEKFRLCWRYRSWVTQSLNWAERNRIKFGEARYLVIKFEDLVTDPANVMHMISKFLDISYENDLLSPTMMGNIYAGNNHEGVKFKSISAININRWKERMPSFYGAVIEGFFNPNWLHYNYKNEFRPLKRKFCSFVLSIAIHLMDPFLKRYQFHGKQKRQFFAIEASDYYN